MTLLFVMIIPYFVGVNLMSNKLKTEPQILETASTSSEVLGASDYRDPSALTSQGSTLALTPENLLIGLIGFLGISTVVSLLYKKLTI